MTQGVKYLGSKRELLHHIDGAIRIPHTTVLDVFSGTTRVGQHFRKLGKTVVSSDLSQASAVYGGTYLEFDPTPDDIAELERHLSVMNNLLPVDGWLTANYTGEHDGDRADGRCFQRKNTMRGDAARDYAETVSERLRPILITSIIRALDAVDNTVGIQQAYLKQWCARSYRDIEFLMPELINGPVGLHLEGDCLKLDYPPVDVAYLDPPYSAHSYSTYYHIWDSIAKWDKPQTSLKARRRADRVVGDPNYDSTMTSPWNSRKTALVAFSGLVSRLDAKIILISYSNESLVSLDELMPVLEGIGSVEVLEVDYKRNVMSQIGNATINGVPEKKQRNIEYVIRVQRK